LEETVETCGVGLGPRTHLTDPSKDLEITEASVGVIIASFYPGSGIEATL
jgi:hypothetical protein